MNRDTDVPELDVIFRDIERCMGVKHEEEKEGDSVGAILSRRRISRIDVEVIRWWHRLFRTAPRCVLCERRIEHAVVWFQGPFVSTFNMMYGRPGLAACLDRESCNQVVEERTRTREAGERESVREGIESVLRSKRGARDRSKEKHR